MIKKISVDKSEVWGHGAMLLFSLCVSVSYILGAMVANDIEPGAITAARFLIGAIVMGALLLFSKNLKRGAFKKPWRFFVLGLSLDGTKSSGMYVLPSFPFRLVKGFAQKTSDLDLIRPFLKRHIGMVSPRYLVLIGKIPSSILGLSDQFVEED